MLKNSQEVGVKYMRLWEEMEWPAKQAMDALKIPEAERQKYMDKIKNVQE